MIGKQYRKKDGSLLSVGSVCSDSGGHATLQVYDFALNQQKAHKKVYAIKGRAGSGPIWEYKARVSKTHKAQRFYYVGVDTAKDAVYSRLKLQTPGEHFIHFSKNLEPEYYNQITSESPKWEVKKGRPRKIWVLKSGVRNEALDCFVYAFAALYANYQDYERACADYEAMLLSTPPQPGNVVAKSGYLERFRY